MKYVTIDKMTVGLMNVEQFKKDMRSKFYLGRNEGTILSEDKNIIKANSINHDSNSK